MRTHMRVPAIAVLLVGLLLAVAGCPKHENFPQPLNVQSVPTPFDFVITQPDTLLFDYDFTWDINDPNSVVDRYRIYLVGSGLTADELLGETQQTTFLATFPFSVSGLRFAVSAVSTENVEGTATSRIVP